MLKQDDFIKANLVSMGWRFGQKYGGGPIVGQLVMHAIANRVRVGWGSWLQVIDRIPNFMAESTMPKLDHPSIWEPVFVKLLHSVDGIYDGSAPDQSKGALYWCELNSVESGWFKVSILERPEEHRRVLDMNSFSMFT